jgi:hypothetical protein
MNKHEYSERVVFWGFVGITLILALALILK